jgi:hypothetical protein
VVVRWALDACVVVRWRLGEVAPPWQCGGPLALAWRLRGSVVGPGRSRGGEVAPAWQCGGS